MKLKTKSRREKPRRLNVIAPPSATPARPGSYGRWRAGTLAGVYLLFGLHIAHWKLAGRTLAPLELNEVLYTLELGIVTAGFLFMLAAMAATVIFGRFFCSWGCHILALEDLCAWLLAKLRIRPKSIRSRVLAWVPPAAMFYMFIWPQIERLLAGRPAPSLRLLGDGQGWASFITHDYWRNLPGPWITTLTFLICGFAIVYVLGSRGFCTYGCPYGVLFRFADRFAPGRIRLVGDCDGCALCTAGCQSQVRVHEEVLRYGKVVNPACLKDLDCVTVCPKRSLEFGFTRPAPLLSWRYFRRPFDFTLAEDLLMAAAFVATLLAFRGLYDAGPFLMTLGLGAIVAYLAVVCLRLVRAPLVRLNNFELKRGGRLTRGDVAFAGGAAMFAAFFAHSAFIRWHEFAGQRVFDTLRAMREHGQPLPRELIATALGHLEQCERWGLTRSTALQRRLAGLHDARGAAETAEFYTLRVLEREPEDIQTRLDYAQSLLAGERLEQARAELERVAHSTVVGRGQEFGRVRAAAFERLAGLALRRGETDAAARACEAAIQQNPDAAAAHELLAQRCIEAGRYADAVEHLRVLARVRPGPARHYNLGVLLAQLGRDDEAIRHYRAALAGAPNDPEIHNNLGFVLARRGETAEAAASFRRAIELDAGNAHAHFNLARLLLADGQAELAAEHFRRAAALDPAYADLLRAPESGENADSAAGPGAPP